MRQSVSVVFLKPFQSHNSFGINNKKNNKPFTHFFGFIRHTLTYERSTGYITAPCYNVYDLVCGLKYEGGGKREFEYLFFFF